MDRWLSDRLPMDDIKHIANKQASKPLPPHTSWFHTFGSLTLFLLANQIITGILLMIYYRPHPDHAFESVKYITTKAAFGWLIRGLHAWGATLMLIMMLFHMIRTFFMGSFKKPREMTWIVGAALFFLTLTFGFTGYLLPWNQLSYWATTIGTEIAGSVPFVGDSIKRLLLGGEAIGTETLARFYVMHVIVLPWVIVGMVSVHLFLMRVQGLATMDRVGEEIKPDEKTGIPFFPHHVLKELVIFSIFFGAVISIVVLFPPELGEKADPFNTPAGIKPEWYFLPTYQLLKYFPKLLGLFISTLPSLLLLFWPLLDRTPERRPSKRKLSTAIGIFAIILAVVMGFLGYMSEREVNMFGQKYHINHYGVPVSPEDAHK